MYTQIVLILALLLWWYGYIGISTGIVAILLTMVAEKLLKRKRPTHRIVRYI